MGYAEELPTEVSETTAGELRGSWALFALTIEGKNRGGENIKTR